MSKTRKKISQLHKKVDGRLPYVIHACGDMPAFSTHSHGMTELGFPEFLMDPLSFGPQGTGSLINSAYKYFQKTENKGKLEAVKNGETVELTQQELVPDGNADIDYVYCFRRVYPDFEMVKHAYCIESPDDIDPKMWFVQIYVKGDEYVLTDAYYMGGVQS